MKVRLPCSERWKEAGLDGRYVLRILELICFQIVQRRPIVHQPQTAIDTLGSGGRTFGCLLKSELQFLVRPFSLGIGYLPPRLV
jgi:hypothetical protein